MDKSIEISDELVKAAQDATGESDERIAVETILRRHLSAREKNKDLLDLVGKIEFAENFDPKALRFTHHDPD
jgi:hypothetical protein